MLQFNEDSRSWLAIICVFSALCWSGSSIAGEPDSSSSQERFRNVRFIHKFYHDGDAGQCGGSLNSIVETAFGAWTPAVAIDTDNRPGGCYQQFAILDPDGALKGLRLWVNFWPDGNGQCDSPGEREIPITHTGELVFSKAYRIDADNRPGGCQQRFWMVGREDLAFDVDFQGVADQCQNKGTHTVTTDKSVQIRIDTDNRSGGCTQRFRLRRR